MIKKISDKDKKDWEDFIYNKESLPNKDLEFDNRKIEKTIRSIDLHGHTLESANQIVEEFINSSFDDGFDRLTVITGKGLHSKNDQNPYVSKSMGILKYSVREFIETNKDLSSKIKFIEDAKIKDGGQGAFYIYLKKKL